MGPVELFESVPNFSEGRRREVIDAIASRASAAFVLDTDADPDHNRAVISLAGSKARVVEGLLGAIGEAVERIDVREHHVAGCQSLHFRPDVIEVEANYGFMVADQNGPRDHLAPHLLQLELHSL